MRWILAAFRLAARVEWLSWLLAFAIAVLVDGYVVLVIEAKEFRQHGP